MPTVGGDTLFASMYAAHNALSEGLRQTFSGLRAVHSSRHVFGKHRIADDRIGNSESAQQDALHPVIITHPDSGRKALYVNSNFTTHIEGCPEAESKALLDFLYHHAENPNFQCRFRWEAGSIAMWDNRAT